MGDFSAPFYNQKFWSVNQALIGEKFCFSGNDEGVTTQVHGWRVMKIESLAGKILWLGQALLHGSPERIKIPLGPPLEKGEDSGSPLL